MIEVYYISIIILLSTLIYTSFIDLRERRVRFSYWYPLIIFGTISTLIYIAENYTVFDLMTNVIIITTAVIFYASARLKIMGGADAWALIFITIFGISIPFSSLLNNAHMGIGVSTYINALIISFILYPMVNYFINLYNGVKGAPLYYMFFAQRYNSDVVLNKFGYIIPSYFYLNIKDFIIQYKNTKKLLYTKNIKKEPLKYANEILSLKERGVVWVFNAVPFIVYITLGFITTILFGDVYNAIVGVLI
jgi:preflagellin peptidase FlaK